jgi:hypothetical protein
MHGPDASQDVPQRAHVQWSLGDLLLLLTAVAWLSAAAAISAQMLLGSVPFVVSAASIWIVRTRLRGSPGGAARTALFFSSLATACTFMLLLIAEGSGIFGLVDVLQLGISMLVGGMYGGFAAAIVGAGFLFATWSWQHLRTR